jgi:hypothetical protein
LGITLPFIIQYSTSELPEKLWGKKFNTWQHLRCTEPDLEETGDGCVGIYFENTFSNYSAAHPQLRNIISTIVLCVFTP